MGSIVSLLVSILGKLIADEIKDSLPAIASRVTIYAANLLPLVMRERYTEEWQSHLEDIRESLSKTFTACGFIFAALKISYRTKLYKLATRFVAMTMLVFCGIILLPLWYISRYLYGWSENVPYQWEENEDGKIIRVVLISAQLRIEYLLRVALQLGLTTRNKNITLYHHSYPYCFCQSMSRIQTLVIAFRFVFYSALISVARGDGNLKEVLELTARCDVPVF